jgi:hypothetical protein
VHLFVSCQALGLIPEMREIVEDLDGRRRELFQESVLRLREFAALIGDKGYHSNDTVLNVQQAQARSYIPEPKRPRRKWAGKADEQKAVYANRRRVQGNYGKRLLKKRGELIEPSFA